MSTVMKVEVDGRLHLSDKVHGWKPHTQIQLVHEGEKLILKPTEAADFASRSAKNWFSRTPGERAAAFRDLLKLLPPREGPEIPDEALRRENIYD
jgi:hypothetical protein